MASSVVGGGDADAEHCGDGDAGACGAVWAGDPGYGVAGCARRRAKPTTITTIIDTRVIIITAHVEAIDEVSVDGRRSCRRADLRRRSRCARAMRIRRWRWAWEHLRRAMPLQAFSVRRVRDPSGADRCRAIGRVGPTRERSGAAAQEAAITAGRAAVGRTQDTSRISICICITLHCTHIHS